MQKTAYEMRISDWSSDVCSSDLYLDGKTETIATLKCLGAPSALVFRTYLAVVLVLAAVGTPAGIAVGATAPLAAPPLAGTPLALQLPARVFPLPALFAAAYGLFSPPSFLSVPPRRAIGRGSSRGRVVQERWLSRGT